jgi:hypothetical protein
MPASKCTIAIVEDDPSFRRALVQFSPPALGNIERDPPHPERLAAAELDATTPGDPTHLPIWQQHAILDGVFTLGLNRAPDRRIPSRTIFEMHARDQRRAIQARVRR